MQLAVWAIDVEGGGFNLKGALKAHSTMRAGFGHIVTTSYDAPKDVRVLEVTDTGAPALGHSEHLQSVVDQLLPVRTFPRGTHPPAFRAPPLQIDSLLVSY